MAQIKTFGWTNPATAVARNEDLGFVVTEITTVNVTDGGSFYWNSSMPDGYYLDVDSGAITTSNGFTPLSQNARYGAAITAFSNANPGVITATGIADFGFAAGDTIKVAGVADDGTGDASLNNTFTVASVTATAITLDQNTSVTDYSVWVSGGFATRVSDADGDPVPTENKAIRGITLGTGVVGGNTDVMVATAKSSEPVV
jgi:hypothetical protein